MTPVTRGRRYALLPFMFDAEAAKTKAAPPARPFQSTPPRPSLPPSISLSLSQGSACIRMQGEGGAGQTILPLEGSGPRGQTFLPSPRLRRPRPDSPAFSRTPAAPARFSCP